MDEEKTKHVIKLPIDAFEERVTAEPKIICLEEELKELLYDLKTAVKDKTYIPQTATSKNPALSDDYIFDSEDEEEILNDLGTENFVAKIKDLGKGAVKRQSKGYPQEYLYVFQYPCRLWKREMSNISNTAENILIYIKINNRKIPYQQIFIISFHKNQPET